MKKCTTYFDQEDILDGTRAEPVVRMRCEAVW